MPRKSYRKSRKSTKRKSGRHSKRRLLISHGKTSIRNDKYYSFTINVPTNSPLLDTLYQFSSFKVSGDEGTNGNITTYFCKAMGNDLKKIQNLVRVHRVSSY